MTSPTHQIVKTAYKISMTQKEVLSLYMTLHYD